MALFFRKSRGGSNKAVSTKAVASKSTSMFESLEDRKLFAAQLTVANLDVLPGPEQMVFQKIARLHPTVPNRVHDRGVFQLQNTGTAPLTISGSVLKGPFAIIGALPSSIAPGKSVNITVQFTATTAPAFTYNQTAGLSAGGKLSGAWLGSLTFKTNDPATPTWTQQFGGWWQYINEHEQEAGLQTVINLLSNYKTNIAPPKTVELNQGVTKKYYGEEVVSAYWSVANPAKSVFMKQLYAGHGQGNTATISYFAKGTKTAKTVYTTDRRDGQSFFPALAGTSTPAAGSFTASGAFGFKIDNEWSDDKLNIKQNYGGGHHVRFFPMRDHNGGIVANTYFLVMDYAFARPGGLPPNYDFQDNVIVVGNIKPAGN